MPATRRLFLIAALLAAAFAGGTGCSTIMLHEQSDDAWATGRTSFEIAPDRVDAREVAPGRFEVFIAWPHEGDGEPLKPRVLRWGPRHATPDRTYEQGWSSTPSGGRYRWRATRPEDEVVASEAVPRGASSREDGLYLRGTRLVYQAAGEVTDEKDIKSWGHHDPLLPLGRVLHTSLYPVAISIDIATLPLQLTILALAFEYKQW